MMSAQVGACSPRSSAASNSQLSAGAAIPTKSCTLMIGMGRLAVTVDDKAIVVFSSKILICPRLVLYKSEHSLKILIFDFAEGIIRPG